MVLGGYKNPCHLYFLYGLSLNLPSPLFPSTHNLHSNGETGPPVLPLDDRRHSVCTEEQVWDLLRSEVHKPSHYTPCGDEDVWQVMLYKEKMMTNSLVLTSYVILRYGYYSLTKPTPIQLLCDLLCVILKAIHTWSGLWSWWLLVASIVCLIWKANHILNKSAHLY